MKRIENIMVTLKLGGKDYEVVELVFNQANIFFRYNSDFMKTGLNLSPIKLPFKSEPTSAHKEPFEGLYGVFNDSLPDGWGCLLFDRTLTSKGIDTKKSPPLNSKICFLYFN